MQLGAQNKELQTVAWQSGKVRLIDQTALPEKLQYVEMADWREVSEAIRTMVVRGAPAIGCAAALGIALGARGIIADSRESFLKRITGIADTFRAARPTAVNLFWAIDRMLDVAENTDGNPVDIKDAMLSEARLMLDEDIAANRRMGKFGADLMPAQGNVLTHCNAGALATVGYGTALGVIRAAVEEGKRIHVYADETRPRLAGHETDRLGIAARQHSRHRDRRQHGGRVDAAGQSGLRDCRRGSHRGEWRYRQQNRHVQPCRACPSPQYSFLRGRAVFHH